MPENTQQTPPPAQVHGPAVPTSTKPEVKPPTGSFRGAIITILIILIAPAIALLLTLFVFQQYEVDGPSMQPTLHTGNRLIVFKLPETWARITGHPYVPKRGDIVIFTEKNLDDLTETGSDQLVKRVIGLPGDHIVIKNDVITIYNKQHPHGFEPDKTLPYSASVASSTAQTTCSGLYCNLTIPSGYIFVCGDNRTNSLDSRVFGIVPVKSIIGQLVLRMTPLSSIEKF